VAQGFRADGVEWLGTEMRDDMPAQPLLNALDRRRVAAPGGPPMRLHVLLEGDGTVTRIDEFASAGVRLRLGEPYLGVLERVERAVLDTGDALDAVPRALAVHGCASALPGLGVGALLQPSVFYVAGQGKLLAIGEERSTAVSGQAPSARLTRCCGTALSGLRAVLERESAGLLLFTDPGVQGFPPVHDATARAHTEAGRPLPPMPPDVEGVW
jgi:hypothetical protein